METAEFAELIKGRRSIHVWQDKPVPEELLMQAIELAHRTNQDIIRMQEQLVQALGKPKAEAPHSELNTEALAAIDAALRSNSAYVTVNGLFDLDR